MGSRKTGYGVEKVYEAAQKWVDCALRTDDSLFTPGKAIWRSRWLGELHRLSIQGGSAFFQRLESMLANSPPEIHQLMAEVFYINLLIPHEPSNKQEQVERVLTGAPGVEIPPELVAGLKSGLIGTGLYHTNRSANLGFLIAFAKQWKEKSSSEHKRLHDDPWEFKRFAYEVEGANRALRESILHLVFPDTFERIVNVEHKKMIASTFANVVEQKTNDVDRDLGQIRPHLEAKYGVGIHLYEDDIRSQWDPKPSDPWDEFVRRAQAYINTGRLESEEIDYKVEIGRKLATAREAVLRGDRDWTGLVKSGIGGNLIYSVQQKKLRDWVDKSPSPALKALEAIWTRDDLPVAERVDSFNNLLPPSEISGSGTRTNVASVLLMGLDVERYPPFGVTVFNDAYVRTSYDQPEQDADERALYEHALGFLDRFIEEALERELTLRHRLDAQSVVWALYHGREATNVEDPRPHPQTSLQALANGSHLPVDFLEEIESLLDEKLQVIFQGPPGTGKTYVALKLAKHLAGSEERVTLVQLHPSYAYEDFVQGFRPTLVDGRPGFEMRDGPLLRATKRARAEPDAKHFLVIDEINRGSLAKVLGELYFLLEYRDEKILLQYSDEPFSLPDNLYIIGTMNTADRSIALVDLALRRRFYFVEFHPDDEPVKGVLRRWLEANTHDDMEWLADVVEQVNELLEADRHAAIGPSYFMKENLDEDSVRRIWKHSVLPYIEERRFGEDDSRGKFDLDRLMDSAAPLNCIVDGLSRLTNISREEASSRIEAAGGAAQANISARWRNWHAAFGASGLKRVTLPKDGRPTLRQLAETNPRFIARVRMHLVAVINGEAFEACENRADMDRRPNHYWIIGDSDAENTDG